MGANRKIFVKKEIICDIVKKELETRSIADLAEEYGYNKDYFRLELKKLNIESPRKSGCRIWVRKTNCKCGNINIAGRNICNTCRNKLRRDKRANKIKLTKLF